MNKSKRGISIFFPGNRYTTNILYLTLLGWIIVSVAYGQDDGFRDSSDGIIKGLSKPKPKRKSKFEFHIKGKTEGVKHMKRIVVYQEDNEGNCVKKTILIFQDEPPSGVNLKIEFDVNSYVINPGSFPLLNEVGKALTSDQLKTAHVLIKGHTDSDGDASHNLKLSFNRALSVKQYLIANFSVDPLRLKAAGYGEQYPMLPNTSLRNKQLNRRVEIESVDGQK
ncbi:MAG: OmpA family protein [Desulfobacterales bacterium]|uniref:OmpA family protein n=1 Tax=Candidatus Desulfatibia vada TaxID=2841696 RepID=A0A8J6P3W7_9BACT|nr:OmpA family protein [Candidatus Desulfatibia vada]MBL6970491.1 OmpA family protein [Desulfobacterales bacterium]MBL7217045.1 OmpA family protein [Desulfobacteraceae bacterium]